MVHNVLVYWCITSPKGSVGVGVEASWGWSKRERFCSSHSIWSKPAAGWPSLVSTHWCKPCNSLMSAVNLAWLLVISLLGWPSAFDPPKAVVVSEPLVLSLSLSGPVFMSSASSMLRLMSLSTEHPAPLWWVAMACVLYVVQWAWYLSLIFLSTVLSGEHIPSLFLMWWSDMCRAIYVTNMVELLTRQEQQWAFWSIVCPSS